MNLLPSSLSTSLSVPSSLFLAHGGMETDATISDETDKGLVSIVLCTITDKVSDIFSLLFILFLFYFLFVGAKLRLIPNNIIRYICVIIVDICTNADKWRLCLY